ncbi:MAG: hypothetical protein ACREBQ_02610 [Nitrososphaerales archaeon]
MMINIAVVSLMALGLVFLYFLYQVEKVVRKHVNLKSYTVVALIIAGISVAAMV